MLASTLPRYAMKRQSRTVAEHRREVSRRLDYVIGQQEALFARVTNAIEDVWASRRTTHPSLDKEHWFLLARETADEAGVENAVIFKIHSGQRSYIDSIRRTKDVILASPAANGVGIRQTAKKRKRELTDGYDVSTMPPISGF
jgi:hypothetical protein